MHSKNTGVNPLQLLAVHSVDSLSKNQRRRRCAAIVATEKRIVEFITLPDGEKQAARDASLRGSLAMDTPVDYMQYIRDDLQMASVIRS
jgi:hypothetical protein